MTRIAFLGLGAMGSRMARRLMAAGHELTIWNRTTPDPQLWHGARVAPSPRNAAETADVVITMVRDDEAAGRVWLDPDTGALAGMTAGATAIECSTVTPHAARHLHAVCANNGIHCLEAPVLGSRPQSEAGQLIFVVGGESNVLARVQPLLMLMGGAVHLAGAGGTGAAVKLMINALLGIEVAAISELIGAFGASEVETSKALEIIAAAPVASPALKAAIANISAGNFAPLFPIVLLEKDFGYAHDVAAAAGCALPLVDAARAVCAQAITQGYGDDHMTGLVQLYREPDAAV